jgi:AP-1 complex subunit sigma 1/2
MIEFMMLVSRQGRTRLTKWWTPKSNKERARIVREVTTMVLSRPAKLCNFLEWKKYKIIYKRYASLYFIVCVGPNDNELITLEIIHHFVEVLDRYFGNVCELDLIFNFHKAYNILDEMIMAGELQETSKRLIIRTVTQQDTLQDAPSDKKSKI